METKARESRVTAVPDRWNKRMEFTHGGDIYRNPAEYDFSVNINPLGMPEKSLEAAQQAILSCSAYPDWRGEKLCGALAEAEGVRAENILLGNGAAELIYALCFCLRPKKGLIPVPSFGEYESALLAAGGVPVFENLREENNFCPEAGLVKAVTEEIDVLFLCNPNNPTGSLADRELLVKTAQKCEETGTYFCLDECFLPFVDKESELTMKGMLEAFPHLIVLRAFTKVYGMPGLRLGYAMTANKELLAGMRACMQPWNTSIPAQAAGLEALRDENWLARTRQLIGREREYLRKELAAGLAERIYPSSANFIFFKSRNDLKERLMHEKVLIRSCSNYRNLTAGYFRIGIRTHEENRELVRRWKRAAGECR